MAGGFFSQVEVDESDVSAAFISSEFHLPLSSRPWISLPLVTEWRLEGDVLRANRIERFRADIYDMPSVENLTSAEAEVISAFLEEKYGDNPGND